MRSKAAKEDELEAGQDQIYAKSQESTRTRSLHSSRRIWTPISCGADEDFVAMLKYCTVEEEVSSGLVVLGMRHDIVL